MDGAAPPAGRASSSNSSSSSSSSSRTQTHPCERAACTPMLPAGPPAEGPGCRQGLQPPPVLQVSRRPRPLMHTSVRVMSYLE
eukprot:1587435-Lingulodinium_polyedra.AAC.1